MSEQDPSDPVVVDGKADSWGPGCGDCREDYSLCDFLDDTTPEECQSEFRTCLFAFGLEAGVSCELPWDTGPDSCEDCREDYNSCDFFDDSTPEECQSEFRTCLSILGLEAGVSCELPWYTGPNGCEDCQDDFNTCESYDDTTYEECRSEFLTCLSIIGLDAGVRCDIP